MIAPKLYRCPIKKGAPGNCTAPPLFQQYDGVDIKVKMFKFICVKVMLGE